MRIGIDCRMIKATGIGRYTYNLVKELSEIDSANEYILFLTKEDLNSFDFETKKFKKVLANFCWYGAKEQISFPPLLKSFNLDLVHFPHFNVPIFYKGNYIVTIHDLTLHRYKTVRASTKSALTYEAKHFFYKKIIKKAMKNSLKILVPSNFTKRDLIETFKIPEEKIIVIYEGGPSKELLKKNPHKRVLENLKVKKPFILYVGNAYPHKNLEVLIESLRYLPDDLSLVFVGKIDEFYKKIKDKVVRNNLQGKVKFTDFVADEELSFLYKNSAVYVFPSLNEGFGLPSLEAMSFGLPVVSSNFSCLPEILGEAALYFDPRDSREIAKKINLVLKNDKLRNELALKGYRQIKKYSWSKMVRDTLKVYQEVLNEKNK